MTQWLAAKLRAACQWLALALAALTGFVVGWLVYGPDAKPPKDKP